MIHDTWYMSASPLNLNTLLGTCTRYIVVEQLQDAARLVSGQIRSLLSGTQSWRPYIPPAMAKWVIAHTKLSLHFHPKTIEVKATRTVQSKLGQGLYSFSWVLLQPKEPTFLQDRFIRQNKLLPKQRVPGIHDASLPIPPVSFPHISPRVATT